MKLSILTYGFASWGGGVDLVKFVAGAIASVPEAAGLAKQIILPTTAEAEEAGTEFRRYFADLDSVFQLVPAGPSYPEQLKAVSASGADVILPCLYAPPPAVDRTGLAWVGYLYDFQHKGFPLLFTEEERQRRDTAFLTMLHRARHAIVNARSVAADAGKFYGGFPAQLHALPFSPTPQQGWLEDRRDLRAAYGLDRPYFMICNQFWVHKDHPVAIRAMATLVQAGGDALLVCTGETSDYRAPEFFSQLQALIGELGIADRVRILGRLPKLDQIALLKTAAALVQPTRFEGAPGGGAGYDAIAVGVPVIASDIPVNREIDTGGVSFFPVGDHEALYRAMVTRLKHPMARPSDEMLQAKGVERQRRLGRAILDVARQAIEDKAAAAKS